MNFTATFYQLDDANVEERGMEQLPQQQQLTNESIAGIVEEIVNGNRFCVQSEYLLFICR